MGDKSNKRPSLMICEEENTSSEGKDAIGTETTSAEACNALGFSEDVLDRSKEAEAETTIAGAIRENSCEEGDAISAAAWGVTRASSCFEGRAGGGGSGD